MRAHTAPLAAAAAAAPAAPAAAARAGPAGVVADAEAGLQRLLGLDLLDNRARLARADRLLVLQLQQVLALRGLLDVLRAKTGTSRSTLSLTPVSICWQWLPRVCLALAPPSIAVHQADASG
jgi:hypothetical protein